MSTTTKTDAPKTTDAPKPSTLAERAKSQKNATKSATTRKPSAKRTPTAKPKPTDAPKPKRTRRAAPKPSDAPSVDVDRTAAARATALLRHGGAYMNASGVSAKQLRDFASALDVPALAALGGGKPLSKSAAVKLATGETKPTADQKSAWQHATKRYAKRVFGVDGPTTKNKLTGRKIATVLLAIAERDGQL